MEFSSFKTSGGSTVGGLLTLTRAALALGFGLLVAGKLKNHARQQAGALLISIGVASAVPYIVQLVSRRVNRPESTRSMNRQLRSIREDTGLETGCDVV